MSGVEGFLVCLALVVAWDWYRKRGKRAADAANKAKIEELRKLGVKMEND